MLNLVSRLQMFYVSEGNSLIRIIKHRATPYIYILNILPFMTVYGIPCNFHLDSGILHLRYIVCACVTLCNIWLGSALPDDGVSGRKVIFYISTVIQALINRYGTCCLRMLRMLRINWLNLRLIKNHNTVLAYKLHNNRCKLFKVVHSVQVLSLHLYCWSFTGPVFSWSECRD
jgi:hypothetical protein